MCMCCISVNYASALAFGELNLCGRFQSSDRGGFNYYRCVHLMQFDVCSCLRAKNNCQFISINAVTQVLLKIAITTGKIVEIHVY